MRTIQDGWLLREGPLAIRRLKEADIPLLARWLSDPRVLEFYKGRDQPHDEAMVREDYIEPQDSVIRCLVFWERKPIGYIQLYLLEAEAYAEYGYSPQEPVWGMDLFIGEPEWWGRGIGTRLVQAMAHYLVAQQGASRVVLDPYVTNLRAIRCYEKAGFRKVQLLPRHWLHEGKWQDAWLMELGVT